MTYRLELDSAISSVEDQQWFQKTYQTIEGWDTRDIDDVDADYESKYGVKLIFGRGVGYKIKPILAIEFASKGDATWFFLKYG